MIHLREKMKVGPKGQVVIPKDIRDAEQIYPGTEVIFETTDHGISLQRAEPERDPVDVFQEIAFSGKKVLEKDIDVHSYEEELEERFKKIKVKK